MDNNFIYLRSFESISETQFLPIGHKGIQKPDGNHNIRIDSYFDAKPIDLAENISKFFITSQYTIFTQEFTFFAHFNITTPFEIATPHKTFSKEQLVELIDLHNQDCKKYTDNLRIDFPNLEFVTLPQDCFLNSENLADKFLDLLPHKRWNREDQPQ